LDSVYAIFRRWGFGAIAIPALLPPPAPMVPFLLAAGALQYPLHKFLAALSLGRIIRFTVLAILAAHYGRGVLAFISQHGHPVLATVAVLLALGIAGFFAFVANRQRHKRV
jgi:membrane protein DedA with SNARE-associated domain